MLRSFTIFINYLALVIAVWLSLYVVTRSPRRLVSWLTGLTILSIAGLYLNILLALNPPPIPIEQSNWLRLVLPFWPTGSVEGESNAWLQGWSISLSVALWHHATVILRPGKTNPWRKIRVGFGYALAIFAIIIQACFDFLCNIFNRI